MFSRLGVLTMPPRTLDVFIALAVFVATVYPSLRWEPSWANAAWAALSSLPLAWRRLAPVPVALICGISTTALAILDALPDIPYGQLVATYTIAELCGPIWRVISAGVTAAGIVVSLAVPHEAAAAYGYTGMVFVSAWALGTGVRARRNRIALLEERTHRLAEEQLAAAARERSRIARDMHDVLAHCVSMMVLQAEGGASILDRDPVRARAAFDAIGETGREALVQLRHTLGVLREPDAEEPAMPLSIESIGSLLVRARRTGLDANLVERGTPGDPPQEVGVTLYRLVQEALTNVVKHACARKVDVVLEWAPAQVRVSVIDDGRGSRPGTEPGTKPGQNGENGGNRLGHGLAGMRERVDSCGGELTFGPGPGGCGFRVAATLPVTR
jgi:signal transduction histidine kinase